MNSFVSLTPVRLEKLDASWRGSLVFSSDRYAVFYDDLQYFYTTEICLFNYLHSDRELKDPTSTGCIIPH